MIGGIYSMTDLKTLRAERVGLIKRGLAVIIDVYLSSVLANIPILFLTSIITGETKPLKDLVSLPPMAGILSAILGLLFIYIYYVIIPVYIYNGQTLGKRLMKFKVVKKDGCNVDLKTMTLREMLGSTLIEGGIIVSGEYFRQLVLIVVGVTTVYTALLYVSFGITLLSMFVTMFTKSNRPFHDVIGRTKVITMSG